MDARAITEAAPEPTAGPAAPGDEESLLSPEFAARLSRLALLARRIPEARRRGRRRTRRPGAGTDTIDTRPYAIGDDPRRIAWPAYARLERLVVRLIADDAPLRLALVVDTSASMGFRTGRLSKLRQASRIAAGFAAIALSGEDRVAAVATSAVEQTSSRAAGGRAGLGRVLWLLDGLRARGGTDLAAAASRAAAAAGGRALCVVLTDLFDPAGALAGAKAARARGHEVVLVEVLDPAEIDPPDFQDRDLEDEETGELVVLPPGGARAAYLLALAAHRASVGEGAAALGAPVLRVTTADAFEDIVTRAAAGGLLRSGEGR